VADPGDGAEDADVHCEDAGFGEEHGGAVEHAGGDHAAEVGGFEIDLGGRTRLVGVDQLYVWKWLTMGMSQACL
jgi:hypothetical protein